MHQYGIQVGVDGAIGLLVPRGWCGMIDFLQMMLLLGLWVLSKFDLVLGFLGI